MNVRCDKCGMVNSVNDADISRGTRHYRCAGCGSINEIHPMGGDINERTTIETTTFDSTRGGAYPPQGGYSPMGGGAMPPQPPMPQRPAPRGDSSATTWLIVALIVVVAGLATWYFASHSGSEKEDVTLSQEEKDSEDQELLIRSFYEDCVFGSPKVSQIEKALTASMLAKVKEGDNKYALYKFATSHSEGTGSECRVEDIRKVEAGVYRVDYIDRGIRGSSNIYVVKDGDVWKIDGVEFLRDEAVKTEAKEESPVVRSDTYTYSGYVSEPDYKITGTLTFTPATGGYKIKGKYAYLSTLTQNGDKASSWIQVTGFVDNNGNFRWEEYIPGNTAFHPIVKGQILDDVGDDKFTEISGINESGHVTFMSR